VLAAAEVVDFRGEIIHRGIDVRRQGDVAARFEVAKRRQQPRAIDFSHNN